MHAGKTCFFFFRNPFSPSFQERNTLNHTYSDSPSLALSPPVLISRFMTKTKTFLWTMIEWPRGNLSRTIKILFPIRGQTGLLGFVERRLLYPSGFVIFLAILISGLQIIKTCLYISIIDRSKYMMPIAAIGELNVDGIVFRSFGYRPVGKKSIKQKKIVLFLYHWSNRISWFFLPCFTFFVSDCDLQILTYCFRWKIPYRRARLMIETLWKHVFLVSLTRIKNGKRSEDVSR